MDPTVPGQGVAGRSWLRSRGWFWPAVLLVALLVTLPSASPGRAAAEIPAAQVEVDGASLFQLRSSKDYSAEQRADAANGLLQSAAKNPKPAVLQVVERNGLPVISLDGKPLLTVTRLDVVEGLSQQDQAETWRRRLEDALEQGRLQRQPAYIRRMGLRSLAVLLGAFLLQRLLGALFRRAFTQAWPHPNADGELIPGKAGSGFLIRALLRSLQVAIWIGVAGTVAELFPISRMALQRLRDALSDSLASPFLPLGERSYSVLDVIVLITLFLALAKGLGVLQYTGIGKGAQEGIAFVVQYALLFVGSLVLLQLWGLDLSSLTLFASVFGVALGLGLQGITKNFISGLIIIFERPIQVGDFVEIGELQGTVQKISLRSTEVVTLDRIAIIVPNAEFLESQVVNWSHGSPTSRLMLPIGVAYGSDCTAVRHALVEACKDYSGILQEPEPKVFFTGFGDSSLNFSLLVWINQPMRQYEIISDLNFRIEAVLRQRGISVPFPQRDLHLRNDSLQLSLPPELSEGLRALLADRGQPSAAPPDQDGA